MNAAEKAKLEQRLVIGLLLLFLVTLAGVGKSIGLFGSRAMSGKIALNRVPGAIASPPLSDQPLQKEKTVVATPTIETPRKTATPEGMSIYSAQELRDPLQSLLPLPPTSTQPEPAVAEAQGALPQHADQPLPPITIEGIWWQGPKSKVIIGGKMYGIGDYVEGATVKSIEREAIVLEHGGTMVHLDLTTSKAQ